MQRSENFSLQLQIGRRLLNSGFTNNYYKFYKITSQAVKTFSFELTLKSSLYLRLFLVKENFFQINLFFSYLAGF